MEKGCSMFPVAGFLIIAGVSAAASQHRDFSGTPEILGSDQRGENDEEIRVKVQTQIYILSGTFGGILFLLIILVLGLALALAKLKTQLQGKNDKYGVTSSTPGDSPKSGAQPNQGARSPEGNHRHTSTINAYVNSAFNGNSHEMEERRGEPRADLTRLGYEVFPASRPISQQENNSRVASAPKRETEQGKHFSRTEIARRGDSSDDGGIPLNHMSSTDALRYVDRPKWTPRPSSTDRQHKKGNKYEHVDYMTREEFRKPSLRATNQIPRARSKDDRVYTHTLSLDDGVAPRSTTPDSKSEYRRSEGRRNRY